MTSSLDPRRELFDELFARFHKLVYSWLLGQTGSRESAEDVLQETFVKIWTSINNGRSVSPDTGKSWVLVIARNALGDHHRRAAVRSRLNTASTDEPTSLSVDGPDETAIRNEEIDRLQIAIESLPVDLRTVLTMTVVGEMTSEEIGEALGKPAGTIRSQLFEARKRLAKRMGI